MKLNVLNFENNTTSTQSVNENIFGVEVRRDVLYRAVRWQLAKKRLGNHATKGRSDVHGTTKKPFRQKGTGNARQGSLKGPHQRGGGVVFGPVVRSHAHKLTKKFRRLALRCALSLKCKEENLYIAENLNLTSYKTKDLLKSLASHELNKSTLFIVDGDTEKFSKGISNIAGVDTLSVCGANVYDILKKRNLVITESALKALEERLS
jgi:large subunit ribosomal protein L4